MSPAAVLLGTALAAVSPQKAAKTRVRSFWQAFCSLGGSRPAFVVGSAGGCGSLPFYLGFLCGGFAAARSAVQLVAQHPPTGSVRNQSLSGIETILATLLPKCSIAYTAAKNPRRVFGCWQAVSPAAYAAC